jgi:vesicle coat complex subunit|tara:strand:- start:1941 stop:2114 length:174 start_codon:yes stop_codon:yes gene_type:complete
MPELKEEHFEIIDQNKAKAHEEQKEMRKETLEFIGSCSVYDLQVVYSLIKGIRDKKK